MKNKKMVLWIALLITAVLLLGCSKKNGSAGDKGSSATGNAKIGAYNSENDFKFDWDTNVKDGIIITEYIGTKKEVNIPPSIQNNPVTGIGEEAFSNSDFSSKKTNITKVTIPDSVISIGDRAFFYCESLANVTIPNNVTSIGQNAFSKTLIKNIIIPNSVSFLGVRAFADCTSLTSVTIGNSVTSIGEVAFAGCTSLTSINIPDSITNIGENAFRNCTSLTSVTIPNNVTSIGNWAFGNCTSLTGVTIGSSVTNIGEGAFSGTGLTSVTIPDNVTSIKEKAFYDCNSLTSVTFQGTITRANFKNSAFNGDLWNKYFENDGGIGTYKRFAGGETWKK